MAGDIKSLPRRAGDIRALPRRILALREKTISLFVSNLHASFSSPELEAMFCRAGRILYSFIPQRDSNWQRQRFCFSFLQSFETGGTLNFVWVQASCIFCYGILLLYCIAFLFNIVTFLKKKKKKNNEAHYKKRPKRNVLFNSILNLSYKVSSIMHQLYNLEIPTNQE